MIEAWRVSPYGTEIKRITFESETAHFYIDEKGAKTKKVSQCYVFFPTELEAKEYVKNKIAVGRQNLWRNKVSSKAINLFDELEKAVELLQSNGIDVPESTQALIDEIGERP